MPPHENPTNGSSSDIMDTLTALVQQQQQLITQQQVRSEQQHAEILALQHQQAQTQQLQVQAQQLQTQVMQQQTTQQQQESVIRQQVADQQKEQWDLQRQQLELMLKQGQDRASQTPGVRQFRMMDPKQFQGTESALEADEWLHDVEGLLTAAKVPKDEWVTVVRLQFSGIARNWWNAEEKRLIAPISWEDFKKSFNTKFFSVVAKRQLRDRYLHLTQGNRSVDAYDAEHSQLMRFAPAMVNETEELASHFLWGLEPPIRDQLVTHGFTTQAEMLAAARVLEDSKKLGSSSSRPAPRHTPAVQHSTSFKKPGNAPPSRQTQLFCNYCKESGHRLIDCPKKRCYTCGRTDHYASQCPQGKPGQSSSGPSQQKLLPGPQPLRQNAGGPLPPQKQAFQQRGRQNYTLTAEQAIDTGECITGMNLKFSY